MTLPRLSPFSWMALLILLYEIEEQVQFPATIRLLENSVCQRHYAALGSVGVPVDETLCKIGAIQHRLATIRGWYSALSVIPSTLPRLGLEMGSANILARQCSSWVRFLARLAEGVGRRLVLALVTVGIILGLLLIYVICRQCFFLSSRRGELCLYLASAKPGRSDFLALSSDGIGHVYRHPSFSWRWTIHGHYAACCHDCRYFR